MRLLLPAIVLAVLAPGADVQSLLKQVARYDYGQSPAALRELDAAVFAGSNSPAEAARLEKLFVQFLRSDATAAGKQAVSKHLSLVGGPAAVPALSALLLKPETAEMARYALERIPAPAAVQALRAALPKTSGKTRVGIANSLGVRRDEGAVKALAAMLASADAMEAEAAANALGKIGGAGARDALLKAKPSRAISEALLAVAESFALPAGKQAALGIYKRLDIATQPEPVRIAALNGMASVAGAEALPALEAALKTGSAGMQAAAIAAIGGLPGGGKRLAAAFASAPTAAKIQIATALADRGDPAALPVLTEAVSSDVAEVRIAAYNGLAKVGAAPHAPLLSAKAAASSGDEQAAARNALARIRGLDADEAILKAIPGADAKQKVELIVAAGARGVKTAPEILFQTATDADATVRRESLRALRETAGPQHAQALLGLLAKTTNQAERQECERAVAAAVRRSNEAPVADVTAAFRNAATPADRASLLSVMAMVGNDESLAVMREALHSQEAATQRAAILALSDWPTAAPIADLMQLAGSTQNLPLHVLAIRGFVNLVRKPSDRTPAESAALLTQALKAARRPDEKKAVLAAAQRFACPESLELAKTQLNDPAVAAEAKLAVTALERSLSYRRQ